jgi:colanic acid/amylovoran biosynthesis glycosyltransferase
MGPWRSRDGQAEVKNVLIYRSDVLPQTQTFILAQAKALTRYKPHFTGLAPAHPSLPLNGFTPCLLTEDRSRWSRLRKASYRITGVSPSYHRRARALGPALVHAHFAEDGPMALPLAVSLGLPLVVTLHGSIEPIADKYLLRSLRHGMYVMRRSETWRKAAVFLCVSQFIYDVALKAGYPKDKLLVHYIGIDTTRFRQDEAGERDKNMVLFVGRLQEKKGCRYLISAMAEVQKTHAPAKVVILGSGPDREALEAQARDLGVAATFAGVLPPSEVAGYLKKARVFCAPSVRARDGNSEGLGMVFAEAQASGLPVVSFAHGGVPEVVRHGETGLLAPEGDTGKLAEYIGEMLSESYPWEAVSARGIGWIRSNFDLAKQTRLLEDIYDQTIGARR